MKLRILTGLILSFIVLGLSVQFSTRVHASSAGPTAQKWYFAEGRVGGGFVQWLTIANPNDSDCTVNIEYDYKLDRSATVNLRKTESRHADRLTRFTEYVNNDLGIVQNNLDGAIVSSIVSTSDCTGVVVERPMYFSDFHNVSSGTDVFGATEPRTKWFFAEVPRGTAGESFLSILNPHTSDAHVTVKYFVGGATPLQETKTIFANSTDRFFPDGFNTDHEHLAVEVDSDVEIVVERPSYYRNINGVSGASDLMGIPQQAEQWVLPSGSTATPNHEDLYVANTTPSTIAITVELLSKSGIKKVVFDGVIPQNDQHIIQINVENDFTGSSSDVSIVVTGFASLSTRGAHPIIVQRVDYDNYTGANHATPAWNEHGVAASNGIPSFGTTAEGEDFAFTLPSSYSFAEGFVSANFNEYMDIANPTTSAETVSIELVNMLGEHDTFSIPVPATSRQTFNVTSFIENSHTFSLNNPKAYAVSAIVTEVDKKPFAIEREMHWNAFSTAGISTVPGFSGLDIQEA